MRHKYTIIKKILIAILIIFITDIAGIELYLNHVLGFIKKHSYNQPKYSDAGVILFSGFDNGGVNRETQRRLNQALYLFKKGYFHFIVCSGGSRPNKKRFGSILMKNWLLRKGIKKSLIFVENSSYDTLTNIRYSIKTAKQNRWKKILVISSPLHIYRIAKTFHMPKDIKVSLYAYNYKDVYPSLRHKDYIQQVHHEWLSFVSYYVLPQDIYDKFIRRVRLKGLCS